MKILLVGKACTGRFLLELFYLTVIHPHQTLFTLFLSNCMTPQTALRYVLKHYSIPSTMQFFQSTYRIRILICHTFLAKSILFVTLLIVNLLLLFCLSDCLIIFYLILNCCWYSFCYCCFLRLSQQFIQIYHVILERWT